ncbi:oxidoreductase [Pseudoclavibacter sp. AY1F1]|uniref:mannitol dehydrogenase family protein n=1 Tax=Pseudoclavibacter sp. AY1F1 TaxID=2080583 RepID=UPI000CE81254|nr:mannitol dehydrogenase family protein [Pseudoclavibacter sp. AY1F1]PPF45418.1 oxidoreductase [Pseudoclavibacter sp. AY1F1]
MSKNLNRSTHAAPAAPRDRRIVHLGLGAFHRAHQAWYTSRASDGDRWGITAYTGTRPDAATALQAQDGLYTLIERSVVSDRAEIIDVITEAVDGADVAHLERTLADSATALVTLTITEAGYQPSTEPLRSTLHRLALGLEARRLADAGPIALVSCDNLPDNGSVLRAALAPHLEAIGRETAEWVASNASFVSTSVDRITPRTTAADLELAESLTGLHDSCAVTTEPFSDWILQGEFPAGRPAWETAGARFVQDLEPYERRKLWLLNGAHTLLAAAGPLRGHAFVDEAFGDPLLRQWVEDFWDAAARHLPSTLNTSEYRRALTDRFANLSIRHELAQIATGVETKLRVRVVPVLNAELAAGRDGVSAARPIAAHLLATEQLDDTVTGIHKLEPNASETVLTSVSSALDELRTALDRGSLTPLTTHHEKG